MRKINKIIVHCSATPEGRPHTLADFKRWHVDGNGWDDVGYHFIIDIDGSIYAARPLNQAGAHTKGHNGDSIGVCYVGGVDADMKPKDTRTAEQEESLDKLLTYLAYSFNAPISGHNDYTNAKACPSFKAKEEYAYINENLNDMRMVVGA